MWRPRQPGTAAKVPSLSRGDVARMEQSNAGTTRSSRLPHTQSRPALACGWPGGDLAFAPLEQAGRYAAMGRGEGFPITCGEFRGAAALGPKYVEDARLMNDEPGY